MVNSNPQANVKLFAFHSCLYANDISYFAIKGLKSYIKDKDKETRKIYGALEKRAETYYSSIMTMLKDYEYFFADYNSEMDSINDDNIAILTSKIEEIYNNAGVEDSTFLAKTEVARSIVMLSVHLINSMQRKLREVHIEIPTLKYFSLQEVSNVIENFSKWVNRRNPAIVDVGKNEEIISIFNAIGETLGSYKNFEKAWYYAVKQDNTREYDKGRANRTEETGR